MSKLSVVLATRNEEKNIGPCLASVKGIADEIVVVDEYSTDDTREVAKKYGAKVYLESHHDIFHITKQKALERATGDWILQLDADEVVTKELAKEIKSFVTDNIQPKKPPELFLRHQKLVEQRDGKIGKETGEVVAFFIPRLNYFLRKPLRYAGAYPDGVIRLVKRGKAHFPQVSVHEQIEIDGRVGWLANNLEHHDSPTLARYLSRLNRYTDLKAAEFREQKLPKNIFFLFSFSFVKPILVFLNLYFRHKGFLDGIRGFIWSLFSSWHYPIAYYKYWTQTK